MILVKGPTQGLDDTAIRAEYSANFSRSNKNFSLSLYYNKNKFFVCKYHKNTSIQNKKLWNKTIFIAFRKYFKRFCSQCHEKAGLNGYVQNFSIESNIIDNNHFINKVI